MLRKLSTTCDGLQSVTKSIRKLDGAASPLTSEDFQFESILQFQSREAGSPESRVFY